MKKTMISTALLAFAFQAQAGCLSEYKAQMNTLSSDKVYEHTYKTPAKAGLSLWRTLSLKKNSVKVLVAAEQVLAEEVTLPESKARLDFINESGEIYGELSQAFINLKASYESYEGSKEVTNSEFASMLLNIDNANDPKLGSNPFCHIKINKQGKEKLKVRTYNKKRIVRALFSSEL